jgi:Tol biopolymer transport system component/DNA-binding winged helix-turn-helix (wHTH) protein
MGGKRERRFRFGDFELDPSSEKLLRDGRPVKIQPQPLRVLEVLVEHPGEIVSREELRTRVWGESTFVEFDQGLNYCIRQIRLALRDEAADPVYIETLPKQGYRFVANVQCPDRAVQVQDAFADSVKAGGSSRRMLAVAVLVTSVVLIAAGSWWNATRNTISSDTVKPVRLTKLTSFPGQETDPAFSPDGRLVAFSWDGERGDNRDIYVMPVGSQTPVRLTHDPAIDISPSWSPDGSQIGFLRLDTVSRGRLVVIRSDGGPERTIREVRLREDIDRAMRPLLAWTPDGKEIAYATQDDDLERTSLYVTDLQGTTVRRLFVADEATMGAAAPPFSRDGKWLAYTTVYGPYQARLFVRPLQAGLQPGEAVPVTEPGGSLITSPIWAPDSRHLLFTQGSSILEWRPGAPPRQVFIGPRFAGMSAVWGLGQALRIVTADSDHAEIHMIPLAPGGLAAYGDPIPFAPSTAIQVTPQFSPDGKYLVFPGTRSGDFEIWVTDADGRNARQMTHLNATIIGFPRWSPDSKRLAFHAWLGTTKPQVYTIDLERILGTGDGKAGDAVAVSGGGIDLITG